MSAAFAPKRRGLRDFTRTALALAAAAATAPGCSGAGGAVPRVARTTGAEQARASQVPPAYAPRIVAYVNCLCGFGVGSSGGACLQQPDPTVNQVKAWEEAGRSPITHYAIAFLSFRGARITTDDASVWNAGPGSSEDFALDDRLRAALQAAERNGKRVLLSIGGEAGSERFLAFWRAFGAGSAERVPRMRAELLRVAQRFSAQNGLRVDGYDVDLELGARYAPDSPQYLSTRDLINAVPEPYQVSFAPQVANGLCAAPAPGDALGPEVALGGACDAQAGSGEAWSLAQLDRDCTRADGSPKLAYFGVQYYNAEQDQCCGGGQGAGAMVRGTAQHYVNLANGWPAGAWPAFAGVGANRLVLGKPACSGCAFSNYLALEDMHALLAALDRRLSRPMGGLLFWDLCRMLGRGGSLCVGGHCQPSWGGEHALQNLQSLQQGMAALNPAPDPSPR